MTEKKTNGVKRVRLPKVPDSTAAIEQVIPAVQLRDGSGKLTAEPSKDKDGKEEVITRKRKGVVDLFYLVNPGGAIHELTREDARERLGQGRGWRRATADEIKSYKAANEQVFDAPIAARWVPEPDVLPELE